MDFLIKLKQFLLTLWTCTDMHAIPTRTCVTWMYTCMHSIKLHTFTCTYSRCKRTVHNQHLFTWILVCFSFMHFFCWFLLFHSVTPPLLLALLAAKWHWQLHTTALYTYKPSSAKSWGKVQQFHSLQYMQRAGAEPAQWQLFSKTVIGIQLIVILT